MLKENTYTMRGFSQFAYVLTNYHVIEAAASVRVKFVAGDSCTPFFIYEDEERDLALLVVASPTVKPVLTLSRRKPTMGSRVFAIGCPEGFDFTISDGLLSGRRKESGNEWLQTSAPVSNGSSGGPLIDIFGEVIGVATLSHRFGQNLNFAIPVENVMHFLKDPKQRHSVGFGRALSQEKEDCKFELAFMSVGPEKERAACKALAEIWSKSEGLDVNVNDLVRDLEAIKPELPTSDLSSYYAVLGYVHCPSPYRKNSEPLTDPLDKWYRNAKGYSQAVEAWKQALALNPELVFLCYDLASLLDSGGEEGIGLRYAESVVSARPKYARGHWLYGRLQDSLEQYERALPAFREAARLNPKDIQLLYDLATSEDACGNHEKAVALLRTGLESNEKEAVRFRSLFAFAMGNAYKSMQKYDKAIQAYSESKSLGMIADSCDREIEKCRELMK